MTSILDVTRKIIQHASQNGYHEGMEVRAETQKQTLMYIIEGNGVSAVVQAHQRFDDQQDVGCRGYLKDCAETAIFLRDFRKGDLLGSPQPEARDLASTFGSYPALGTELKPEDTLILGVYTTFEVAGETPKNGVYAIGRHYVDPLFGQMRPNGERPSLTVTFCANDTEGSSLEVAIPYTDHVGTQFAYELNHNHPTNGGGRLTGDTLDNLKTDLYLPLRGDVRSWAIGAGSQHTGRLVGALLSSLDALILTMTPHLSLPPAALRGIKIDKPELNQPS